MIKAVTDNCDWLGVLLGVIVKPATENCGWFVLVSSSTENHDWLGLGVVSSTDNYG